MDGQDARTQQVLKTDSENDLLVYFFRLFPAHFRVFQHRFADHPGPSLRLAVFEFMRWHHRVEPLLSLAQQPLKFRIRHSRPRASIRVNWCGRPSPPQGRDGSAGNGRPLARPVLEDRDAIGMANGARPVVRFARNDSGPSCHQRHCGGSAYQGRSPYKRDRRGPRETYRTPLWVIS